MIERDLTVPPVIDAVRAVGVVTRQDYDDVVVPILDAAEKENRKLRVLCVVDEAYRGLAPDAVWTDVTLGMRMMRILAGCAVVTDLPWVRETTRLTTFFLPRHVRVFDLEDRDAAVAWLAELPGALADVRLRREEGVVEVDVDQPLRREDVNVITSQVDDWLQTHAELPGLVLHARGFPGWENISGLLHHLRFVAGHHGRIARVALVVDGAGIDLAARAVSTLLHPEVRRFPADSLEDAVTWAAAAPARVG